MSTKSGRAHPCWPKSKESSTLPSGASSKALQSKLYHPFRDWSSLIEQGHGAVTCIESWVRAVWIEGCWRSERLQGDFSNSKESLLSISHWMNMLWMRGPITVPASYRFDTSSSRHENAVRRSAGPRSCAGTAHRSRSRKTSWNSKYLEIELAKLEKFLPNVSFPFAFGLGVLVLDVCFSHYQCWAWRTTYVVLHKLYSGLKLLRCTMTFHLLPFHSLSIKGRTHPTSNQKFAAFAVKTNRDRGKVLLRKYCRSHGIALPSHPAMEAVLLLRFNTLGNSYSQSLQRRTFQSHRAREMPRNFGQIQDLLPGNPATYISTT